MRPLRVSGARGRIRLNLADAMSRAAITLFIFCEADVRVGGTYRVGFGRPGTTPYIETGHYSEIVPLKRLAFEETVTFEDKITGGSENVLDFKDLGDGRTQLVLACTGE